MLRTGASCSILPAMPRAAMNNWQDSWIAPCSLLCCHTHASSCPCADIGCDSCYESIVRTQHGAVRNRFVCMECAVDEDYESEHWSTHLCEKCFNSRSVPHFGPSGDVHAARWLRIDGSSGEHTQVTRSAVEGATLAVVSASDLTTLPRGDDEECPVCVADLSASNPRARPPGCGGHSEQPACCVEGVLRGLQAYNRLRYHAGPMPRAAFFCPTCRDDERKLIECAAIVAELDGVLERYAAGAEATEAMEQAPSLARKPLRFHQAMGFSSVALSDSVALLALTRWCVEELKVVHALGRRGKVNAHLHAALDARLEEVEVASSTTTAAPPAPRVVAAPSAVHWREVAAVAVVTLVTRDDPATGEAQVLTLQRGHTAPWAPGMWSLPGGKIDPGEDTAAAAARELREESGLRAEAAHGTMLGPSHYTVGGGYGMCAIVFHEFDGEVSSPLPISPELGFPENDEACWVGAAGGGSADAAGHRHPFDSNITLIEMAIAHRNARSTGGIVWE